MSMLRRREHIHDLDPDLRALLMLHLGIAWDQCGPEIYPYYGA